MHNVTPDCKSRVTRDDSQSCKRCSVKRVICGGLSSFPIETEKKLFPYFRVNHLVAKVNKIGITSRPHWIVRELKQPRRRRQQKPHKFAYLTMENSIFACFARVFFIFWHFEGVLVLSMTWNDLFCSAVVWTTWAYDDKCPILSSYVPSAGSKLIPGQLEDIFQA